MEVFHYVANELKDTANFESNLSVTDDKTGAVYNDFDFDTSSLMNESGPSTSFSQCTNVFGADEDGETNNEELVPQRAIDVAVLEADKTEAILYEHLSFESDLMDYVSEARDINYMTKVYKIATFGWRDLVQQMTAKTFEIFQMRERTGWEGADALYDAWLLSHNFRRKWFPYKMFISRFPRWEKLRKRLVEEANPSLVEETNPLVEEANPSSTDDDGGEEEESVEREEIVISRRIKKRRKYMFLSDSEAEINEGDCDLFVSDDDVSKSEITKFIPIKASLDVVVITSEDEDENDRKDNIKLFEVNNTAVDAIIISDSE